MPKRRIPERQGPKNGTQKLAGPVQPGSQLARCGGAGVVLQAQSCNSAAPMNSAAVARTRRRTFGRKKQREAVK